LSNVIHYPPSISQFSHGSASLDHLPEAHIIITEQPAALTLLVKFVESATDIESPSDYISTMVLAIKAESDPWC
jgi:hypothetical protein